MYHKGLNLSFAVVKNKQPDGISGCLSLDCILVLTFHLLLGLNDMIGLPYQIISK